MQFQVGATHAFPCGLFPVHAPDSITYLPVHKDVDNGVVDGGTFGKVGWYGSHQRVEGIARVGGSKACKEGVGAPAEAVGKDHHHYHARHFLLSLLCGL